MPGTDGLCEFRERLKAFQTLPWSRNGIQPPSRPPSPFPAALAPNVRMPRKPKSIPEAGDAAAAGTDSAVAVYEHHAKRRNLPPILRFDPSGASDRLPAPREELVRGEMANEAEIACWP